MQRSSNALQTLPAAASAALRRVGADLATARKRRRESLREWAARLNVSVPTLMRLEKGDPGVSAGVLATALWLVQKQEQLAMLADPKEDLVALDAEIRAAQERHRPRGAGRG